MNLKLRMRAEREIVRATIKEAIKQGWTLDAVNNGEDDVRVSTVDEAMEHAFACDDAHVYFTRGRGENSRGWLYVVLGNDGWDVVSDYTINLEPVIKAMDELVDRWEEMLS